MTEIVPKRGLRFLHARVLDNEALAHGEHKPALYQVTKVARGMVYYAMVEKTPGGVETVGRAKECTPVEDFAEIVKS
jgi:hypothetical protein